MVSNYPIDNDICLAGNTGTFINIAENSNNYISWSDRIPFGKYKNKTFMEVSNINASYLLWANNNKIIDISKLPSVGEMSQLDFLNNQKRKQRANYIKKTYNSQQYESSNVESDEEKGTRIENDGYYERVFVDGCLKEEHELDGDWGIFRTGFSKYYD